MKINDLELKSGLERATIRYYEKEGMIAPSRRENGYRDYSEEDFQQLLKIKLLRQLGMSLSKIQELQQGSADFQAALQEQIKILHDRQEETQYTLAMCQRLQSDRASFGTLNAAYYLDELRSTRCLASDASTQKDKPFQEFIPTEYHPYWHFFARMLDMSLLWALIIFVQVVVFNVRGTVFIPGILMIAVIWIFIEAACYRFFGTTPGKWAFGIHIEDMDGYYLSYEEGRSRAFRVFHHGLGFCLPIWSLIRLYRCWKPWERNENRDHEWNDECVIIYDDPPVWKWVCKIILICLVLFGLLFSADFLYGL